MERDRREIWAKRVVRWKESGLSAKEFAAETGVNAKTLSYWRWRLGADERASRAARPRTPGRKRTEQGASGPPRFIEVRLQQEARADDTKTAGRPEPLELVLRDGLCVRIPMHFDADGLRRLLSALEGR